MSERRSASSTENWTPRQREVLDLLAQGRSNAEIAEQLGVSLDGAKWHVREIMGRLGVDSREDAAEYWRQERGLPARLRRRVAVIPLLRLGPAGAAIPAGILLVIAVAIGTVVALRGDNPPAAGSPDATETPVATPQTTASPAATTTGTSPTETPLTTDPRFGPGNGQDILATIDGQPIYELKVSAAPVSLPAGSVLYYSSFCAVCSGGELYRTRFGDAGEPTTDDLTPNVEGEDGYPLGQYFHDGGSRFAVIWCRLEFGPCGKLHNGTVDTGEKYVLLTADGGITWEVAATVPAGSNVLGFDGGDVVVSAPDGNRRVIIAYPAGRQLPGYTSVPDMVMPGGGTLHSRGSNPSLLPLANESSTLVTWRRTSGGPVEVLAFPGGNLNSPLVLSEFTYLAMGNRGSKASGYFTGVEFGELTRQLVLVDLESRLVAPVGGFEPNDEAVNWVSPLGLHHGPFVRVATDPCLNVREQPTTGAPALGCYAPGVIFQFRTNGGEFAGWMPVITPDGREGWVASEYVEPFGGSN